MKKCLKLAEPPALINFRNNQPNGTWEDMQNDPHNGGMQAYRDIKQTLVRGQRCLCAFCEKRIATGTSNEDIRENRSNQRVEHFHPKSDMNHPPNWSLHWPNLWAVCLGGSKRPPEGEPIDVDDYLPPLPDNLSCDAYKEYQVTSGKLNFIPEGYVLAPDEIPTFPPLIQYAPDGSPEPNHINCAATIIPNNNYPDTTTLVSKTIEHLNLKCMRLKRHRCIIKAQLEKQIQIARQQSAGVPAQDILLMLARRFFSPDANSPWPEFFTLIRLRLGVQAEVHLQAIQFNG